jgi:nucleoside 2-deoxyribosyltransferase
MDLTELGRDIVYAPNPETELVKKREAFLRVEPFRKVLDYYKGSDLPEMKYLGNTLDREFKIEPEDHEEFSRLFRENCTYLGIRSGSAAVVPEVKSAERDGSASNGTMPPATVTLAESGKGKKGPVAFVIMPFQERDKSHPDGFFQEVLRSLLTPAASNAGFTVRTANRQGSDIIQSTIIRDLMDADLVIADLTEHNPNVLFELGVRIAKEKPVVLVKAEGTGRIFDVDNLLRVYEYKAQLWRTTIEKDLPALTEFITGAWETRDGEQTYMKILHPESAALVAKTSNADGAP